MAKTYTREEFIATYGPYIARATKGTGIFPGTVVAQAILESQGPINGVYKVGGSTLSQEANNYFGIKCHNWNGATYNIDTREQDPAGNDYTVNACFRAYNSVEDSINDYVNFLLSNSNYHKAGVFNADSVYSQAKALKKAGYATDVNYARTLGLLYKENESYIDKYSRYGLGGIWSSFRNNPSAFVKRNKTAFIGLGVLTISLSIGIYALVKYNKKNYVR